MKNYQKICSAAAMCLFLSTISLAQTSAFTYQGKLTDSSVPANGVYSMRFDLFAAPTGGTALATQTIPAVQVTNGIFTASLDFGGGVFDGSNRYLEITVGSTTLSPRQPITSAPYAIRSSKAAVADALSAACVLCITNAQISSVAGSKVTGTVLNAETAFVATTVAGIIPVASGGTGSSTKNFVDLSTSQTIGGTKIFTEGISGDGSALTNVTGTMRWQGVSGTSQQAQPNTGYMATNAGETTITLPASPNIGDIVRVSGIGPGGWKIAQNAGQSVLGANLGLIGLSWTARESNRNWSSIASSADGSKLVAVVLGGQIYTSTDSGVTWTPRDSDRAWESVASSADGSKLVAVVQNGQIYTSTDSGVTWTATEVDRSWTSVASSSDGSKLVAGAAGGRIYTSTDSGVSWTPRESNRNWQSVASSADGGKLVAGAQSGQIYTSTDSGGTWTARDSNRIWQSVASSADGSKTVALVLTGQIYTSTDSGVSWTQREVNRNWQSVASSADGSKLVAVASSGQIYTSTDSVASWTPRESNRSWTSVASSADGGKLAAVVLGGQIYTSIPNTTPGTAGYLVGGQGTAIELQYIGNGQFLPISHEGTITGF